MTSDSLGFLLQCCIGSQGIAVLPAYVSSTYIRSGVLAQILPSWNIPDSQVALLFPGRDNLSKAQTAFRSYAVGYDFSQLSGEQ